VLFRTPAKRKYVYFEESYGFRAVLFRTPAKQLIHKNHHKLTSFVAS